MRERLAKPTADRAQAGGSRSLVGRNKVTQGAQQQIGHGGYPPSRRELGPASGRRRHSPRIAPQLVTVRAIGTFLADPNAIPAPIVASLARQFDITDPGVLTGYSTVAVRWKHTAEIRCQRQRPR